MEAQQQKTHAEEEYKRKLHSRKSIQTGGALTAADALTKIKARHQKDAMATVTKAEKDIKDFCSKAAKILKRAGINARKAERERKNRLKELYKAGDLPDPLSLIFIRDPEKYPTDTEKEALSPSPDLLQALTMAREEINLHQKPVEVPGIPIDPYLLVQGQSTIIVELDEGEGNDSDSDNSEPESINSIDSIARNADFISLGC